MPSSYAKIQNGVVVNTQMMLSTDIFDAAFVWAQIAPGMLCVDGVSPVQIGCTYDGTNFTAAPQQ